MNVSKTTAIAVAHRVDPQLGAGPVEYGVRQVASVSRPRLGDMRFADGRRRQALYTPGAVGPHDNYS